ncbi:MAG: agmatinase [Burkholderiaceae bacterium]|nr:agmatinase [Burkholderiaceae bacterium]
MSINRRKFSSLALSAAAASAFGGLVGVGSAVAAPSPMGPPISSDASPTKFTSHDFAFFGLPTFWRLEHTRELQGVDIAVMGVPFDNGVSHRSGTRFGPRALRETSIYVGGYQHPWPYDARETLKMIDYGDVGMGISDQGTAYMIEDTYRHAKAIYTSGARLFTLGGDHTIPYGMMRAAKEKFGKLAMIHFDSHQDSISGRSGTQISHASFAHDLAEEGTVDTRKSAQVFIRTDMPNDFGYNIICANDAMNRQAADVAKQIKSIVGTMPVYITFDIDALDPAYAPGTGTPVAGGPTSAFVAEVLQRLVGLNVVGADLVEVAPIYDPTEATRLAAAAVARDLIYLMAHSIKPAALPTLRS